MPLPQNWQNIYGFLLQNGASPNAAAGILGNIYGESGGNPESVGTGGNGLIGWTPPLAGAVTGNVQKDLAFQEQKLLDYIRQNGSMSAINAHASSPSAAASYFIYQYERPRYPGQDLPIRETVANDVAAAAAGKNFPQSNNSLTSIGGGGGLGFLGDLLNALGLGSDIKDMLQRAGMILLGGVLLIIGIWQLDTKDLKLKTDFKNMQGAKRESLGVANDEAHGSESDVSHAAKRGKVVALGPNATKTDRKMYASDNDEEPPF